MKHKINAYLWFIQRITGVGLVVLVIMHFAFNHIKVHKIDYNVVMQHISNPVYKILEVFFLIFVVFHGLNGLKGIITDFPIKEDTEKILSVIFCLLGIFMVLTGLYIIVPL